MRAFDYVDATSVEDATTFLQDEADSALIAGGTELLVLMKNKVINPRLLINVKSIDGLHRIRADGEGSLTIGSVATIAELGSDEVVQRSFPILADAIRVAASPQLRNMATVGGNLCQKPRCWYYRGSFDCFLKGARGCHALNGQNRGSGIFGRSECYAVNPSDLAPPLVALGASVVIQSPQGRKQISLADFFTSPRGELLNQTILGRDEMVVEVRIPKQPHRSRGVFLKAMERKTWSFAQASVAMQLSRSDDRIEDVRIVLGAIAPIPWRATAAEDALRARALTRQLIEVASAAAVEGAHPSGDNRYKVTLVRELVKRGLSALLNT